MSGRNNFLLIDLSLGLHIIRIKNISFLFFHNGPIIKYFTKFSKALYDERVQNNFNFLLCNSRETIYLITDFGE